MCSDIVLLTYMYSVHAPLPSPPAYSLNVPSRSLRAIGQINSRSFINLFITQLHASAH